jgi:hypothetical protein
MHSIHNPVFVRQLADARIREAHSRAIQRRRPPERPPNVPVRARAAYAAARFARRLDREMARRAVA